MFKSITIQKYRRSLSAILGITVAAAFFNSTYHTSINAEEKKTIIYDKYQPEEDELWTADIIRQGNNEALSYNLDGYNLGTKERFRDFVVTQVRKISAQHRPSVLFDFYVTPEEMQNIFGLSKEDAENWTKTADFWHDYFSEKLYVEAIGMYSDAYTSYRFMNGFRKLMPKVSVTNRNTIFNNRNAYHIEANVKLTTLHHNSMEEEIKVREKVKELFSEGGALYEIRKENDLISDYDKYQKIWSWFRKNVYYGKTHKTYDALFNGSTMCDGYSALTTMFLREAGIPAISMSGVYSKLGQHGWNWVQIGGRWYSTDTTNNRAWQSETVELAGIGKDDKGKNYFEYGHKADAYPTLMVNMNDYLRADQHHDNDVKKGRLIDSGKAGSNISWILDNGVLTLSGSGDMRDFASETAVPWHKYKDHIKEIKVGDGITSIGANAFYELENVSYEKTKAELSKVSRLGNKAFKDNPEATEDTFTVTLKKDETNFDGKLTYGDVLSLDIERIKALVSKSEQGEIAKSEKLTLKAKMTDGMEVVLAEDVIKGKDETSLSFDTKNRTLKLGSGQLIVSLDDKELLKREYSLGAKALGVTMSGDATKLEDQNTELPTEHSLSINLNGVLGSDDVSVDSKMAFADSKAGTREVIASEIKLTGETKDFYILDKDSLKYIVNAGILPVGKNLEFSVSKGEETTNTFIFGDTITIKGQVKDVEKSSIVGRSRRSISEPVVALYYGDKALSEELGVKEDGSFELSYDSSAKTVPTGHSTLTVRYRGANAVSAEKDIDLTIEKKTLTPTLVGKVEKVYDKKDSIDTTDSLSIHFDEEEVSATAQYRFEDPEVGTNKLVFASEIQLDEESAKWYELSQTELSASVGQINKARREVKSYDLTFAADETLLIQELDNELLSDKDTIFEVVEQSQNGISEANVRLGILELNRNDVDQAASDRVKIVARNMKNYEDAEFVVNVSYTSKTAVDIQVIPDAAFVYDKTPKQGYAEIQASYQDAEGLSHTYEGPFILTYYGTSYDGEGYYDLTPPINAGRYEVKVSIPKQSEFIGVGKLEFYISPRVLQLRADDSEINEGDDLAELTYQVDGLLDGDALFRLPSLTISDYQGEAGKYAINISDAEISKNYQLSYLGATLTVNEIADELENDEATDDGFEPILENGDEHEDDNNEDSILSDSELEPLPELPAPIDPSPEDDALAFVDYEDIDIPEIDMEPIVEEISDENLLVEESVIGLNLDNVDALQETFEEAESPLIIKLDNSLGEDTKKDTLFDKLSDTSISFVLNIIVVVRLFLSFLGLV